MSSINASSSVAASLAASNSNSARNSSPSKTTSLSSKSQISANVRIENSIELETPRGDQVDLSQKAQLSIESTQVTKLVIGRESGLFGSEGSNKNSDTDPSEKKTVPIKTTIPTPRKISKRGETDHRSRVAINQPRELIIPCLT